jgi:hypothetical protein
MNALVAILNRLIQWSWQQRNVIETPIRLIFGLLWIFIGVTQIYGVDSEFRWLWLIPIGLNISLFESLWNPFRVLCIVAIWVVAVGVAVQNWLICIEAMFILLVSLVGWYYLIQKTADLVLDHNLRELKRHLHMQNTN